MQVAAEAEADQQPGVLRVQDALGYLDQVKAEFRDEPYVYNQFLDIMKEFKSQVLNTPGVIAEVSRLFRGHNDLIVGFNTFLPPGYRIEQMPHNNEIRIIQLAQDQQQQNPVQQQQIQQQQQQQPQQSQQQQQQQITIQNQAQPPPTTTPQQHQQQQQPPSQPPPPQSQQPQQPQQMPLQVQPSNQLTANIMNTSPMQPGAVMQPVQQPAAIQPGPEFGFNHALNYVNKIKHRFSSNPEIYQQFLEILHAYQRDQHATKVPRSKMLLESEVYNQVARLFQNQRDLLEEFSQFLPDANGIGSSGSNINSLTRVHHQLSPSSNINSTNPPNLSLRHDGSIVMNDDITVAKRQNSRANHQKISTKRQNNSSGNVVYNSTKVSIES